ncbi:NADH/Ubiquinone/plastoquinone (complex I) [Desulfurispirillum indicum S5]|uniref:NADH/Ubiquinone/plastoquinone (Complex I) n=1 Tax=Desulfurispirillum indicum (strain ATCC BAA-1389 / DSM 22839 / S5) TaxID=653733 RepID=E6W1P3_DESIS|nr:proton-conducting transporter membrane subunit [Desulfurispirillum indicum]ADU66592.1 NADH/Ubiquinone/plastoquinone (complex I) [Desulfurispirillum indicum S5]
MIYSLLPLWILLTPLTAALIIFALGEERQFLRIVVNILAAVLKMVLVGIMLWGVERGHFFGLTFEVVPGISLAFFADGFTMLFLVLSALLWLITTIYAIAYLEHAPNRCRFFGFFSLCMAATMGIATAANMFTFFIFYELLTLSTYPLVVHRGTAKALRGGKVYLAYTLGGGALLLLGMVWLQSLGGGQHFVEGGTIGFLLAEYRWQLQAIFVLMIIGVGVKSALIPFHGWLPEAMVAPAPVSALLHAVAVVKAGAFGIVRIVHDVFGVPLVKLLGMAQILLIFAAATIVYGSVRALMQTDIKKRLAYSTVSQVSYITLGIAMGSPLAAMGGIVHLMHQGLMKITLFFCAGNLAETYDISRVDQMNGIARRMPWTMGAFSLAALAMIGIPPMAGFISKWYLGLGAVESRHYWVIAVLLASTILNAAYFLPLIYRAWFRQPTIEWPRPSELGFRHETHLGLLIPTLITALLALSAGLFAGVAYSPKSWVEFIVRGLVM